MKLLHSLWLLPIIAALASSVSGCGGGPRCPEQSDIAKAVVYHQLGSLRERNFRIDRPVNAWADSPEMSAFLQQELQAGGLDRLKQKHGFRCKPRAVEGCSDCQHCTASVPNISMGAVLIWVGCHRWDDYLVRADIGPGDLVKAQTFWSTDILER